MRLLVLLFPACIGLAIAQYNQPYTVPTPVPILKQINRHNEDGSYSYGYEAADGTYKIESKYPTGEVYGKYGFVDDTGSVREVEYGASRRGFEPVGPGINVPPPTLTGNSIAAANNEPQDDGQYREDPSVYHTDPRFTNGERYDPMRGALQPRQPLPQPPPPPPPPFYGSSSQQLRYQRPQPTYAPAPPRYPTSALPPVRQEQYEPEYRSRYPTQYQGPRQQSYSPPVQQPQGQSALPHSDLASYTVNYRR